MAIMHVIHSLQWSVIENYPLHKKKWYAILCKCITIKSRKVCITSQYASFLTHCSASGGKIKNLPQTVSVGGELLHCKNNLASSNCLSSPVPVLRLGSSARRPRFHTVCWYFSSWQLHYCFTVSIMKGEQGLFWVF